MRHVACGQYTREHTEPLWVDQSAKEEEAHHTLPRTVLLGHGSESAMVHGFKSYFVTGDGKRCDLFTITNAYIR